MNISILLFGSLTVGSMGKVSSLSDNSSTEVCKDSFCSHRFLFIHRHLVYFLVWPCCEHLLFVWLCPPQRGASCPCSLKKKRKWNIIALQSCFSFYCAAKWISSICIHTLSWISCQVTAEHWLGFAELHGRLLLVIYFIHNINSVYMPRPVSQFIPLSPWCPRVCRDLDGPTDYHTGWSKWEGEKTNTEYYPHILVWSSLSHLGLEHWYVSIHSCSRITAYKGPDAFLIPVGPFLESPEVGNGKAASVLASHRQNNPGWKEGSTSEVFGVCDSDFSK